MAQTYTMPSAQIEKLIYSNRTVRYKYSIKAVNRPSMIVSLPTCQVHCFNYPHLGDGLFWLECWCLSDFLGQINNGDVDKQDVCMVRE